MKSRKGFTLIEILIVVIIIGILATIGLTALGPTQKKARDTKRIADLRDVATALEIYRSTNGVYPGVGGDPAQDLSNYATDLGNMPSDPRVDRNVCNSPGCGYYYLAGADSGGGVGGYIIAAILEGDVPAAANSVSGTPDQPDGDPYDLGSIGSTVDLAGVVTPGSFTTCGSGSGTGTGDLYCVQF